MSDLNKPKWAELQEAKINAYEQGWIDRAIFWQNEQILKKLTDIIFATKESNV